MTRPDGANPRRYTINDRFWEFEMPREMITMQCTECKEKNYTSTKNKKTTPDRLEMSKFCPRCRKHKAHKEAK